jgi:hypothetical protein
MRLLLVLLLFPAFVSAQQRIGIRVSGNGGSVGGGISQQVLDDSAAALRNAINDVAVTSDSTANIGAQRSKVLSDVGYSQGEITFQTEDGWIYVSLVEASSHVNPGTAFLTRTKNGTDWQTKWQVEVDGFDSIGGCGFGTSGNRIHMNFQKIDNGVHAYNEVYFAYSDDGGVNFILTDSIALADMPAGFDEMYLYGNVKQINGDTLYAPYYANFDGTPFDSKSFYFKTYDNGLSWTFGATVMSGASAGVFPTGGLINEMWLEVVEQGATVATTKLMALIRSEKYFGYHYQLYSNNGGATWVNVGVTLGMWFSEYNATSGPNTFPVATIVKGQEIYVLIGFRGNAATGLLSNLRVIKGPIAAYANPVLWSKPYIIYNAIAPIKSFQNDFGYPYGALINGQVVSPLYDISPKHKSGASISNTKTLVKTIPVDGNNYFDAYNSTSQSITTGTETTVSTSIIRLDSELSYNEDSTKIYFQYDGWYTVSARVTFAASASGTYRRATLWMVDYGDESGSSPSPMNGKYMITQRSIAPSANAEFNRIELFGQIYAYAGMELRLTVQHDVGSDLELNNSAQNDRATIYFKKSD